MVNWYNRNFLVLEFFISVLLTIGFVIWAEVFGGFVVVDNWIFGMRKELYSTIASISGALLGFIITAVSIVIVFVQSEKLELLRKSKDYPTLYRVFIECDGKDLNEIILNSELQGIENTKAILYRAFKEGLLLPRKLGEFYLKIYKNYSDLNLVL